MILGEDNLSVFHQVYTADVLNRMALKAEDDKGLRSLHLKLTSNDEPFLIERIHIEIVTGPGKTAPGIKDLQ